MIDSEFMDNKIFRIEQIKNWDLKIKNYQGPIQGIYRQAIAKLNQI